MDHLPFPECPYQSALFSLFADITQEVLDEPNPARFLVAGVAAKQADEIELTTLRALTDPGCGMRRFTVEFLYIGVQTYVQGMGPNTQNVLICSIMTYMLYRPYLSVDELGHIELINGATLPAPLAERLAKWPMTESERAMTRLSLHTMSKTIGTDAKVLPYSSANAEGLFTNFLREMHVATSKNNLADKLRSFQYGQVAS